VEAAAPDPHLADTRADGKPRTPPGSGGPLDLRVALEGRLTSHPLPASGTVTIGRSLEEDVTIDHDGVSRRHARLHVGARTPGGEVPVSIEDLGSSNGTWVREAQVLPGLPAPLALGELFRLGRVSVWLESRQTARAEPAPGLARFELDGAPILVEDPKMKVLYQLVDRIAPSDIDVILVGETGVGKEVLARSIHARSKRARGPFLGVNCAAFSEALLESELFGHEKGAFTGANAAKPGLLEHAQGGTILLDEVGELPLSSQVKLLRALEERKVLRVGGLTPRAFDVRFIAATNRDLSAEIEEGRFRSDLYFRLDGITLEIPPLRARTAEIGPLALQYVLHFAVGLGRPAPAVTPQALDALLRHPWPGNVRELRRVLERAVLLCGDGPVEVRHLHLHQPTFSAAPALHDPAGEDQDRLETETHRFRTSPREETWSPAPSPDPLPPPPPGMGPVSLPLPPPPPGMEPVSAQPPIQNEEHQRILDALEAMAGNQSRAAKLLGISRSTLIRKLDQYGIPRPRRK
jgi:two-component system, NtrC family, response regulator AtoC